MSKRIFSVFVLIAVLGIIFPAISFADTAELQKMAAPTALAGNGNATAWSDIYLAVGHTTTPFLSFYKRVGDALTKLADPTPPSTLQSLGVAWNGDHLAVAHFGSPYLSFYKREGETLTKLADPDFAPASTGRGVAWNGDYLAVAHSTSPFLSFYKKTGDALNKLTNPTALAGQGNSVAWNGDYLAVAHNTTPFISLYKKEGETLTKLSSPTAPTGSGTGVSWSGNYLAVSTGTAPYLAFYKLEGDSLTKLADPTTVGAFGNGVAWNGDYLAVSPFSTALSWYVREGDTLTKLANPTALAGSGAGPSWGGNYLAVGHLTSPYLSLYKLVITDTTNPLVFTLSPADGAIDVAVASNLVITFDEAVDVENGNITIYKSSDDSVVEAIDVTGGLVTGTGTTTITINPTSNLAEATSYYVQIDATAFDDTSSNSYAGIADTTTWNFTTIDATGPVISETTPVTVSGTDTTPDYTFTTDEAGDITYGGSCTSLTTTASIGANTITFEILAVGTYTDCTVTVTDASDNDSNVLTVTAFTIAAPAGGGSSGSRRSSDKIVTSSDVSSTNTDGCTALYVYSPKTGAKCPPVPTSTPSVPVCLLTQTLKQGSTGEEVKCLQNKLQITSDGMFGPKTKEAVMTFQKLKNLNYDGIVGPLTRGILNTLN